MIAFYILVIIGLILLWFLLSGLFKPIGKLFSKLGKDAVDAIKEEDKE